MSKPFLLQSPGGWHARHLSDGDCVFCKVLWDYRTHEVHFQDGEYLGKVTYADLIGRSASTSECPYRDLFLQLAETVAPSFENDPSDEYWWHALIRRKNQLIFSFWESIRRPEFPRHEWQHEHLPDPYQYEVFNAQEYTFPELPMMKEIPRDNTSEDSWHFLGRCMDNCLKNHKLCKSASQSIPPRRLMEIVGDNLKLVRASSKEVPRYLALSYCWGGQQELRLLNDTYRSFQQAIPCSSLPPVIKDCVTVARRLGIDHVWIDALCIFQDDKADWAWHAPRMNSIYETAVLVCVAVTSPNTQTSFLGASAPNHRAAHEISRAETVVDGRCYTLCARETLDECMEHLSPFLRNLRGSKRPVDCRAWTFQEQQFAVRSVRFSSCESVWRCLSTTRYESLSGLSTSSDYVFDCLEDEIFENRNKDWRLACRSASRGIRYEQWRVFVSCFTERELTFRSDRLPAISGLASRFHQWFNSSYLAGIWKCWLHVDLGWMASSEGKPRGSKVMNWQTFPQPAVFPSWSWASSRESVTYPPYGDSLPRSVIKLVNVDCHPTTSNKFGEVNDGGTVCLRGECQKCFLRLNPISSVGSPHQDASGEYWSSFSLLLSDQRSQLPNDTVSMDGLVELAQRESTQKLYWKRAQAEGEDIKPPREKQESGAPVECLVLSGDGGTALILSMVSEAPPVYQRIGAVRCLSTTWKEMFPSEGVLKTITIK